MIKLSEALIGMESGNEETRIYYHENKECIVYIDSRFVSLWESDELDDYEKTCITWEKKDIDTVRQYCTHEDEYIALPDSYDIHEYAMMKKFALEYPKEKVSQELEQQLHGKSVFRRFKESVYRLGIESEWKKYRDNAYKEIAINWCVRNHIAYEE